MTSTVYVVHCIDTEGPLYEGVEETFKRIKDIFNVDLEPSYETLKQIQNEELDLGPQTKQIANLVAPARINMNTSWTEIDRMLDRVTSEEFRKECGDSEGNGWVYNWFCINHVGFTGENPRRRALGPHVVFDHFKSYMRLNKQSQDDIQFHYHPLAIRKDAHRSGTTYLNSSNLMDIMARGIINRSWFPAAFRPGFHAERPDSHWFLEQWIPFDFGNQAITEDVDQPDLADGRMGDWRRAPKSWIPYHPSHEDYQTPGSCKRWIARCLNMECRIRQMKLTDVKDAFREAREHGKSLLTFTNHDFRDMEPEIKKTWGMIHEAAQEFSDVTYKHVTALEGIRKVLGLKDNTPPKFKLEVAEDKHSTRIDVKASNDIFGAQPFLAIKTRGDEYYWENFDFQGKNHWSYTFDFNNVDYEALDKIGIAANTATGVTEVLVLDTKTGEQIVSRYNQDNF